MKYQEDDRLIIEGLIFIAESFAKENEEMQSQSLTLEQDD